MPVHKPHPRTFRLFVGEKHTGQKGNQGYVTAKGFAENPELYVRSFNMIQHDVQRLFEYIEPCDINLNTYSMQIYNLFFRICVEIEANFKAILRENTYGKNPAWWNMEDYQKVNKTHHLSSFTVTFPVWNGEKSTFVPYEDWKEGNGKLVWYDIYNNCKHNRYQYMEEANFGTMLNAFAGLFVLLSAQFGRHDFEPGNIRLCVSYDDDSFYKGEFGIGDYLLFTEPTDWTDEERYDFDWDLLKKEEERFEKIDYNKVR